MSHRHDEHRKEDRSKDKYDRERDRDRESKKDDRQSRDEHKARHRHHKKRYSEDRDDYKHKKSRHEKYEWGKKEPEVPKVKIEKEKPNYEPTGKLAEETNTFRGVVIKYSEPPEARKPKRRWRLYPFKGEKALPVLHMHRQSGYLIGRDRKIADFAVDHPSCSKQHAAFQFRLMPIKTEEGKSVKQIRPYIMDLESANGTYLNNKKIEPRKYYELFEKDVLKFGFSSREYVLLHENSSEDNEDDAVNEDNIDVKSEPVEESTHE